MSSVDPVTYEVLRHRLWSANEEHGLTIARISGSPIVTFSHDFNPAIHLPDGEVVFSGPYIQYLNAGATYAIRWLVAEYGEEFVRPGDVFLTNDPWIGVSHQLDVCLLAPVHVDGELRAWVSNAVHQYDVGGPLPGSFIPHADSIFDEPLPIPPIRIVEQGVLRPDIEQMFLRRSRLPNLLALDLRAGLGGCNVAVRSFHDAVEEFGAETLKFAMEEIVSRSEDAFMERLAEIPDGRWTQEYFIESRESDELVPLVLGLEKDAGGLTFDNRGDPPQDVAQSMSAIGFEGSVMAAVAAALCNDQLFAIGGAARRTRFDLVPGSLGAAVFPAAMSCANMRVAQLTSIASHVVAKMISCSPSLSDQAVGAGASAGMPVMLISGVDSAGRPYGTALSDHMLGGVAPSELRDGVDSGGHSWDPRSLAPNVEDQELVFPILYLYRHENADSGGAGRRRGANGGSFAFVPLAVPDVTVATVTAGAATNAPAAPGLSGGYPGDTSRYRILRAAGVLDALRAGRLLHDEHDLANGWEEIPGRSAGILQRPDDVVEERWCGSGGLGDPLDREPERVLSDVLERRVSRQCARDEYGVAMVDDQVAEQATLAQREAIRTQRMTDSEGPRAVPPPMPQDGRELRIGRDLRITVAEDPARSVWSCACGTALASGEAGFREGARHRQRPARHRHASVVVHEFFCPSCLRVLSADVGLSGRRPSSDIELRSSSPRQPE